MRNRQIATLFRHTPTAPGRRLGLLAIGLPLALAGGARFTRAQQEAVVRVQPAQTFASSGHAFEVRVDASDVVNLGAFQFTLEFPPDLVAYESVALGPFLGLTGRTVTAFPPVVQTGRVTFVATSQRGAPGPSGAGTLSTVRLKAIAGGAGDLVLAEVLLSDSENGNRTRPALAHARVAVDAPPTPTPTSEPFRVRIPLAMNGIGFDALPIAPTVSPGSLTRTPEPGRTPTVGPGATPTPDASPTSTVEPTPAASPTSTKPDPKIGELKCDTNNEFVSIVNLGGEAMDLKDWMMFSTTGIQTYRFEDPYILNPAESVYLHSGSGAPQTNGNHILWSRTPIWNEIDGDTAQIKTPRPNSVVVDSRDCPAR